MSALLDVISGKISPPADSKPDFKGRTVVITGANVGLGLEAAVKFAQLGANKVILGVRSLDKGNAAKETIEQRSGHKIVEVWTLDMLDYDSITAFAARLDSEPIDIAVLNAGVFFSKYTKSKYGYEQTLQVNLLSTVLLSLLLLPKLKRNKTADFTPVLEIVDSGYHVWTSLKKDVLNGTVDALQAYNEPEGYSAQPQYGASKLYLMYAIQHMASSVSMTGTEHDVHIVAICPGAVKSDLLREVSGPILGPLKRIGYFVLFRTTEQGARTYISGVTQGEKAHGRFWQHDKIQPQTASLTGKQGAQMQERVWKSIVEALGKDVPKFKESTI